ncbi:hypothetical protein [Neptuniibacter sp.]|uniref:hypothetical protein n=1 Tax=Neptuniibacter sp. TaxID=1962643 RepID=UPI003B595DE3
MATNLFLVKNLHQERVVFYWVNKLGKRVSPLRSTQNLAEEWWKNHMFSSYAGQERRKTIIDRRKCFNTRTIMNQRTNIATDPVGRRITDHPFTVTFNLYNKKIQEFVTSIN